jgi:hypothetical protein
MDWNETVIPVGKGDEGFDVSPDGREIRTANAQDGLVRLFIQLCRDCGNLNRIEDVPKITVESPKQVRGSESGEVDRLTPLEGDPSN